MNKPKQEVSSVSPFHETSRGAQKFRVNEAYDVTWTIRVRGRTKGDGDVMTITSQVIRDKLQYLLDRMVMDDKIREYTISITKNNIAEAEETIRRSREG